MCPLILDMQVRLSVIIKGKSISQWILKACEIVPWISCSLFNVSKLRSFVKSKACAYNTSLCSRRHCLLQSTKGMCHIVILQGSFFHCAYNLQSLSKRTRETLKLYKNGSRFLWYTHLEAIATLIRILISPPRLLSHLTICSAWFVLSIAMERFGFKQLLDC